MTDELNRLREANPATRSSIDPLVALDRQHLVELIRDDAGDDSPITKVTALNRRSRGRPAFVIGLVAAAATGVIMGRSLNLLPVETVVGDAAAPDGSGQPGDEPGAMSADKTMTIEVEEADAAEIGEAVHSGEPANSGEAATTVENGPDGAVPAETDEVELPGPGPAVDETCWAGGTSLASAKTMHQSQCDVARVDCDRFDKVWVCSSHPIGKAAPQRAGKNKSEKTDKSETPPSTQQSTQPDDKDSFTPSKDLLAVHVAPSSVDVKTLAVAYDLVNDLGLGGRSTVNSADDPNSIVVDIWGGDPPIGGVDIVDAERAAELWLSTVRSGGKVWIADGGQSEFASAVVRLVEQQDAEAVTGIRPDTDGDHMVEVLRILGLDPSLDQS